MQAKNKKNFESFANPRGFNVFLKIEAKAVGGVSLLFNELKLNENRFCKQCSQVFIMNKHFQEKYKYKES